MKRLAMMGVLVTALLPSAAARATLLWDGDAKKGTGVFGNVQPVNGTITIVDDPTYGKVFKIVCNDNGNTKARSEVSHMKGIAVSNSGDYYIGWRSKWGPLPTKSGKWQVLSQIHLEGAGAPGGPVPFGLSVPGDGKMHFNAQDQNGKSTSMWDHALPLNSWHHYVVHTKMGETPATGYCEIWFDGVKQTLTNGQQRIPCAMAHAQSTSYWKWGVYRSGVGGSIGQSVHYLARPMLGTSYADVANDLGPREASVGAAEDNTDPPNLVEVNENDDAAQTAALAESAAGDEELAGCQLAPHAASPTVLACPLLLGLALLIRRRAHKR
jgi:hypothetical protein